MAPGIAADDSPGIVGGVDDMKAAVIYFGFTRLAFELRAKEAFKWLTLLSQDLQRLPNTWA